MFCFHWPDFPDDAWEFIPDADIRCNESTCVTSRRNITINTGYKKVFPAADLDIYLETNHSDQNCSKSKIKTVKKHEAILIDGTYSVDIPLAM